MLTITVTFEEESGLDLDDPLGDISISDDQTTLVLKTTYLDSWLAAMIEAFDQTQSVNHVEVKVAEEPFSLQVDINSLGLLSISYEGRTLTPQPREVVEAALKEAARFLLKSLSTLPDSERNTLLEPIMKFTFPGSNGSKIG